MQAADGRIRTYAPWGIALPAALRARNGVFQRILGFGVLFRKLSLSWGPSAFAALRDLAWTLSASTARRSSVEQNSRRTREKNTPLHPSFPTAAAKLLRKRVGVHRHALQPYVAQRRVVGVARRLACAQPVSPLRKPNTLTKHTFSIASSTSSPPMTRPNTVYLPFKCACLA